MYDMMEDFEIANSLMIDKTNNVRYNANKLCLERKIYDRTIAIYLRKSENVLMQL